MKSLFFPILSSLLLCPGLTLAAELVTVHPAQITTVYATESGSLVTAGNHIVFVDNTNPADSFAIPRTQILGTNLANGVLTLNLAQPFVSPVTSGSTVVIQPLDGSGPALVAWIGVPTPAAVPLPIGEANRVVVTPPPAIYNYPVMYHGQTGDLRIGTMEVSFLANNPKHSMAWNYDAIGRIESMPNRNEVQLVLHGGDRETFHLSGSLTVSAEAMNTVSQRIAAAPRYVQ